MNTQYKTSLKQIAIKMFEDLTLEQIAEQLIDNKLSLKNFRNIAIKDEYYVMLQSRDYKIQDIYVELQEKYKLNDRALRLIVTGR